MNDKDTAFRDRLLAADNPLGQSDNNYRKELQSMVEKELTWPRRIFLSAVCLLSVGSTVICGSLAITEPELPIAARVGLGVGALFGLAWVAATAAILVRGKLLVKVDNRRIAQMSWVFTVLMMMFFAYLGLSAADKVKGLQMMVFGMIFLICAAVVWLSHLVERSELSTREKLLELELCLAELKEGGTSG